MLILSRKKGEKIIIDEKIAITIIDVNKEEVRLGIEAPRNFKIIRAELLEEVKEENIRAAKVKSNVVSELEKLIKGS